MFLASQLEQTKSASSHDVGGIFGLVEAQANVRLGSQIVNLVGLDGFKYVTEAGSIGNVAVVQAEPDILVMGSA